MTRSIFLLAVLAATITLGAQQPMSPNQGQGNPPAVVNVNPPPTIVVAGSGLYGPSVFMAPTAGFATPQPAAGATQTGFVAGTGGISLNTPVYLGVTSTLGPAPLVYEGGQPGYAYMPGGASVGAAETAAAPQATGRLINDMAPSYYSDSGVPPQPTISLGEVAASFRAVQPHNVRVYTNPPAQQLEPTLVVTGAAIAVNVIPENFIVRSPQETTIGQNPQALTQTQPETQTQPQNQPPAAQAQAPQRQENQPPSASTVPQLPPAQPAQPNQEPSRLPATSTLLPLLGLLGVASAAIGLWLRKSAR